MAEGGDRLITVGKILAPFGVKGWVKVESFTQDPETLGTFREWRIGRGEPTQDWKAVRILECAPHSGLLVARLDGCGDRDAALEWKGMQIAVMRSELPATEEGEYYQADLVGLNVVNELEEQLGRVAGLFSNGAHEVLRVARPEGGEQLLPLVPAVLKAVDLEAGMIRVDWGRDW